MAVESINTVLKGMFACHESGMSPTITEADWDQRRKKTVTFVKPIADAAAGTSYEWPFFHNHAAGSLQVTAITLIPFAALTAHDTNYKTVAVNRRVAAGSATVIGSVTTKITGGTGDWVALTPITITLSATAADLVVPTLGDLSLHLVHSASGVAVPVCSVTVDYFEL